jgi:hypothetical protein
VRAQEAGSVPVGLAGAGGFFAAGFLAAAGSVAAAAGFFACASSPAFVVVTVAASAPLPAAAVVAAFGFAGGALVAGGVGFAAGFAAAGFGFGFAAAGFGLGFAAAALGFAAAGFGVAAAAVFGAVADFGPPASPGFGAPDVAARPRGLAAGLDLVAVPAAEAFVRAVLVASDVLRPDFVPPARALRGFAGGAAGAGALASGGGMTASSSSRRNRLAIPATPETAFLPAPVTVSIMSLGLRAMWKRFPQGRGCYTGSATASPQAIATASAAVSRSAGVPSGQVSSPQARRRAGSLENSSS